MSFSKNLKIFVGESLYAPKYLSGFFSAIGMAWKLAFSSAPYYLLNGVKLKIDRKFITINIYKSFLNGSYEHGEHHILKRTLVKGDRVFEVGTGMGYNSIFAASIIGAENVISFEANPRLIPIIKENYQINNQPVRIENMFLVNDDSMGKQVDFYLSEDFWASNTHPDPTREKVSVPTANFTQKLDEFKPNVLLSDIEGGEIFLLNITLPHYIKKIVLDTHPFYDYVGDEANSKLFKHILDQGFVFKSNYTYGFVHYFERV